MQRSVSDKGVATPIESSQPAVHWGPIIAGAFAASTLTVTLVLLGAGLGLTMVSPWAGKSASVTTIAASTAVWLIIVQWLSSGVGGYIAGRLRTKWVGVHTDEVFFRDTAHGFLAWALATILVVGFLSSALIAALGTGVQAASTVATGAVANAGEGSAEATSYFVDTLFRSADPAKLAAPGNEGDRAATAQASRILFAGATSGEMSAEDRTYLTQLVAARAGLSEPDAQARVDAVLKRVEQAKLEAQQAADSARKAGATFALVSALSLAVGAFIASAAAAFGGSQRDEEEDAYLGLPSGRQAA